MEIRFDYMSDLHNEFGVLKDVKGEGDYLLLAGDTATIENEDVYHEFLSSVSPLYKKVIMCLGNHDYYGGTIVDTEDKLSKSLNRYTNVTFADFSRVVVENSILIIATPLWTRINPAEEVAIASSLNDFKKIKNFGLDTWKEEHKVGVDFIKRQLAKPTNTKTTIIMTHHAPTMISSQRYADSNIQSAYGTDLSELILDNRPEVWIHGHTHVSMNYMVGNTHIICNPRGYAGEALNPDFDIDAHFTVEV